MDEAPRRIELIVAADEPALFFDSVAAAESYLEAIDVRDGVYGPVYGRRGEIYSIADVNDWVVITPDPSKPADPEGLRRLLTLVLSHGEPDAKIDGDLDALLLRCEPRLIGSGKSWSIPTGVRVIAVGTVCWWVGMLVFGLITRRSSHGGTLGDYMLWPPAAVLAVYVVARLILAPAARLTRP